MQVRWKYGKSRARRAAEPISIKEVAAIDNSGTTGCNLQPKFRNTIS
jgi:hypothetical protein